MVYQSHNMSCLLNPSPSAAATGEQRQELKERMRKASFTLGLKSEGGQHMAQSMYKSCIDASAKLGGMPSNGEEVRAEMKKTYIKIGEGKLCSSETEMNTAFTTLTQANKEPVSKPSTNIILKEAGKNQKYYETSHNTIFNAKGNPNEIRSFIPDAQLSYNRQAHFKVGFEKSHTPNTTGFNFYRAQS